MMQFLDNYASSRRTIGNSEESIENLDSTLTEDVAESDGMAATDESSMMSDSSNQLDESFMTEPTTSAGRKRKSEELHAKFSALLDMASTSITQACTQFEERRSMQKDSTTLLLESVNARIKAAICHRRNFQI